MRFLTNIFKAIFATLFPPNVADVFNANGGKVFFVDGDSLIVYTNGKQFKCRLAEVDAPELDQPYGRKAKQFAVHFALGNCVKLIYHGKGAYNRSLVDVLTCDSKRSLSEQLVNRGLAWWYDTYSNNKKLEYLENVALKNKTGLWADPNFVAPWDWRKAS